MGPSFLPRVESIEPRVLLAGQAAGPEFEVGEAWYPEAAVASDAVGNFTVAWAAPGESGLGVITLRRYSAAGVALGDAQPADGTIGQRRPSIAMAPDGSFVVAWEQHYWYRPGGVDVNEIVARRFDAQGQPLGPSFHVNQYAGDEQNFPAVAMQPDRGFVIVYNSEAYELPGAGVTDVFARRYDASGQPLGDEFKVNASDWYRNQQASVAMGAGGDFCVAWLDWNEGLAARHFKADGSANTEEVILVPGYTGAPRVAAGADGNFVVTWWEPDTGGVAQLYGRDLVPRSERILLGIPASSAVATRGDGGFVVTSVALDEEDRYVIVASEFDAFGTPEGQPFLVSSIPSTDFYYREPTVAMNPDGDYVVAWYVQTPPGHPDQVFARRFAHPPTVRASSFAFDAALPRLVFTFSENVGPSLSASDLELVNLTTGEVIDPAKVALSWNAATFTASFSFPGLPGGVLPDGRYLARLPAASIADPGENTMASDASLSFFFLAGDANHDARVDRDDLSILTANWRQSPRTFSQGDFNYDTRVDARDLLILASNWRDSLPLIPEWRKPWSISQRSHFGPGEGLGDVVDLVASEA